MTGDEAAFAAVLRAYADAVRAKDADAFAALYDADVHVFDMWGAWSLRGIGAWHAMAQAWFASLGDERVEVVFRDVETIAAGALLVGHATATYTAFSAAGQALRSLDNRCTLVLQRQGGDWKVVHEHTSAPIEHGSLKAVLRRPPADPAPPSAAQ